MSIFTPAPDQSKVKHLLFTIRVITPVQGGYALQIVTGNVVSFREAICHTGKVSQCAANIQKETIRLTHHLQQFTRENA